MQENHEHFYVQPHPFHKRGYQIFKACRGEAGYPVGEYIILDKNETTDLTEKKVAALQFCLNNKDLNQELKKNEKQFVSFQRVGIREDREVPEQIIFYTNTKGTMGETYRKMNAILTFARGEIEA